MQYYEDIEIGQTRSFGTYSVTRDEVLEFARKYDPQPFHLDDEAAAKTHFGRISASGWHTCAMTMAMIVADHRETGHRGLGSPGMDDLRWLTPVYPGDVLRVETTVLDKRRSKSKPGMGIFRSNTQVFNQQGAQVLTFTSHAMVETRDPEGARHAALPTAT
jgi:acyl dehydratase